MALPTSDEVREVIDQRIRPLVEADGGTIDLESIDGSMITIRLGAACGGCPGTPYTRGKVIEPLLRARFGDDIRVRLSGGGG